jgi:hypothetical protein
MIRRQALVVLAGGAALMLPGCGSAGQQIPDYRFRLAVEVDTPEGTKTGSSVIEVSTAIAGASSIPTPGAVSHRVQGEAVTVDLGRRGLLFALLRSEDNSDWASNVMFRLAPRITDSTADGRFDADRGFKAQFDAMLKQRGRVELPRTFPAQGHLRDQPARPMMVHFSDIADPRTIQKVDPDDLSAVFGKGVKLKRVTIQLTNDAVTTGIDKRLIWLPNVYQVLRGSHFHPNGIPVGDFQHLFSTENFR